MPNNSYNLAVQADVWTEVIPGPGAVLVTSNDNFNYAYDAGQPTEVLGHFALANTDIVLRAEAGQSVWVRNSNRPFRLTVTAEGDV